MHFAITLLTLHASLVLSDWKRWREFYPTMQYVIIGNLAYQFLVQDYHLWEYHPDLRFMNFTVIEICYTFIVFPLTVVMYLSRFPEKGLMRQIVYTAKWVSIYAVAEALGYWGGRIDYHYGWGYWWSVLFDATMFPMLRFHQKKTVWALVVSIGIAVFYMAMFRVPITHALVD